MTTINLGNVGDLSKPVDTLVKKIASAVGVLYEPRRIKEKAKAEAEAQKIQALAEIEVDEIRRRALIRFVNEEVRKQSNMEAIIEKAIPDVGDKAKPENVEEDWIANFFDKCRLISDEEMQALWAKILAGEANSPGKFSKKTVNLVAALDKSDTQAFTKLCSYAVMIEGFRILLVYDSKSNIYTDNGIDFFTLSNLEGIGLVKFDTAAGFVRREFGPRGLVVYYDHRIWLELSNKDKSLLKIGFVMLTEPGLQLASVCGAQPVAGFVDYLKEKWKEFGYKIEP